MATTLLPQRLIRLTARQLENTVLDILAKNQLGPEVLAGKTIPFISDVRGADFSTNPTTRSISDDHVEEAYDLMLSVADALANALVADPTRCLTGSESCFTQELQEMADKIFREPTENDELTQYVAAALAAHQADAASVQDAFATAIQAMLLSPRLLFRPELGNPGAPQEVALADYEMASFLSYTLHDAPPDEELRKAASEGQLADPAVVELHIRRLLGTQLQAKSTLKRFLEEYTNFGLYGGSEPTFPGLASDTEKLLEAILAENVSNGFFETLLTTRDVFASPATAATYGLDQSTLPPDGERRSLPSSERYGIFTQPSWVLSHSHPEDTNVVGRGLFLRARVLCDDIPAIPVGVIPIIPEDPSLTMRERLALHTQDTSCANCHRFMDPLGLALEGFDHLGKRRLEELGEPVDTTGEVFGGGDAAGAVSGHTELMDRLAQSTTALDCFLANSSAYWLGMSEKPKPNTELVRNAREAYVASGGSYIEAVVSLLSSRAASFRAAGQGS